MIIVINKEKGYSVSTRILPLHPVMLALLSTPVFCATSANEVITVTTKAHDLRTAPASISVITADQIMAQPVNDIADVLRYEVGIQTQTDTNGRNTIGIRGMGSKYTLLLVDGKRISSSNALWRGGNFDNAPVPLGMIERVEVIRGPMSALYGSDAIGGVINIITKQPGKTWGGAADADFKAIEGKDGGDQYRTNLGISGPLTGSLLVRVNGEIFDRQAWTPPEANEGIPLLERKETGNLATTLTWLIDDAQRLELDYLYNQDQRPLAVFSNSTGKRQGSEQQIDRNMAGLTHRGNWEWGATTLMANYEYNRIEDFNTNFQAPQRRQLEENTLTLTGYSNMTLADHGLTLGLEYLERELVDPVSYRQVGGSERHAQQALFAQDEIPFGDALTLTLGARYDHHEIFGYHLTPRGYLVYELSDSLTVKGGASQSFKAPSPHQYSRGYVMESCRGRCSVYGNDTLEPETSTSYELGLLFEEGAWETGATLYHNDIKDMIEAYQLDPSNRWSDKSWRNVNKATTQGLELTGELTLLETLSLSTNYTYSNAERENGSPLFNRPDHKANAKLTWQAMPRLSAFVATRYTGTQFETASLKLPHYQTVDLGTGFKLTDQIDLRLGITNLTDVRLQEKTQEFSSVEPGRSYYLSGSARF